MNDNTCELYSFLGKKYMRLLVFGVPPSARQSCRKLLHIWLVKSDVVIEEVDHEILVKQAWETIQAHL